jgi:biopolymer transport protein ExbB
VQRIGWNQEIRSLFHGQNDISQTIFLLAGLINELLSSTLIVAPEERLIPGPDVFGRLIMERIMKLFRNCLLVFSLILFSSLCAEAKSPSPPKVEQSAPSAKGKLQNFDLKKVYGSSPVIYTILLLMSTSALAIWLYTQATFRTKELMPKKFIDQLRMRLDEKKYDDAHQLCRQQSNLIASIVDVGLNTRKLGAQVMTDAMKSEGKRLAAGFWQRLSVLNDIAIIAPMLGLLGTVIGMFYAFYDVNRSIESINAVFDGLGISVGTTVVGLIVAILSMILATTLKYRLIRNFSVVETEALAMSVRIDTE